MLGVRLSLTAEAAEAAEKILKNLCELRVCGEEADGRYDWLATPLVYDKSCMHPLKKKTG